MKILRRCGMSLAAFLMMAVIMCTCGTAAFADTEHDYRYMQDYMYDILDKEEIIDAGGRIFDYGEYLTSEEESDLDSQIESLSNKTGYGIAIVLGEFNFSDYDAMCFADDFYDYNYFGYDSEDSGVLLLIDMGSRYVYISTKGAAISELSNSACDEITNDCGSYLANEDYVSACEEFLYGVRSYCTNYISGFEALVALAIAAVLFAVIWFAVNKKYKANGTDSSYDYKSNLQLNLTQADDILVDVRHTSHRIDNDSGGHGGGGTHTSSSGSSHGGGGSHF